MTSEPPGQEAVGEAVEGAVGQVHEANHGDGGAETCHVCVESLQRHGGHDVDGDAVWKL